MLEGVQRIAAAQSQDEVASPVKKQPEEVKKPIEEPVIMKPVEKPAEKSEEKKG